MTFQGLVWRHVPRGAHPLHVGFILKASGRWNRQGRYGCLYTSTTRDGAIAEYRKYLARIGLHDHARPRDLVSIDVRRLEPVLDLTREAVQARLAASKEILTGDQPEHLDACLVVADWARSQGYQGLLVPSAATGGEVNLIIYIDGPAANLDFTDGPDRIEIS